MKMETINIKDRVEDRKAIITLIKSPKE